MRDLRILQTRAEHLLPPQRRHGGDQRLFARIHNFAST
jgi:hypothetical protein